MAIYVYDDFEIALEKVEPGSSDKFRKEINHKYRSSKNRIKGELFSNYKTKTLSALLSSAFAWSQSLEGYDYWIKIQDKLRTYQRKLEDKNES